MDLYGPTAKTPLVFAVTLGAGDRSVSDRPANHYDFSFFGSLLFRLLTVLPMAIHSGSAMLRGLSADALTQLFQPQARPRKFCAQYCKPDGNNDNRGPWRDNHYNTQDKHGAADSQNGNPPCHFVAAIVHRLRHYAAAFDVVGRNSVARPAATLIPWAHARNISLSPVVSVTCTTDSGAGTDR